MFLTLILSSLLTFMELNCENLFDTRHDSLKNDLEFLPDGSYKWTPYRYWAKLNHLGQEIVAQSDPVPDFVAMCEVENDSVMFDLTKRSLLRNAGYEYVMTSSPDERGIDVALLYQPASFALLHSHSIRIKPLPDTRPTRDILYASGLLITGDTLHIFVVHAPSRRGGEQASRPYRLLVASQLAEAVDSVYAISRDAKIIIAGDFNDYADSPVLQYLYEHHLINMSADAQGSHGAKATYRWHGEWRSLDQILCSPSLAARKQSSVIGDLPFLLEDDEKYGGKKPYRTYLGPRYLGGYSDHLPLVVQLKNEAHVKFPHVEWGRR